MLKKFIVAAQHGNEKFGLKVLSNLLDMQPNNVEHEIGNLEAIAKNVRYIETDLNRSFNAGSDSHEKRIARRLVKKISDSAPDCVIDVHTSISNVHRIAIVAKDNSYIRYLAHTLGMDAVIVMPKKYVKHSLIGAFPDSAISIEFGRNQRSDKLAKAVARCIDRLDAPPKEFSFELPVYRVTGTISKSFKGLESLQNLQYNKALKGYPVLAGKDTYETIGGYLARLDTG